MDPLDIGPYGEWSRHIEVQDWNQARRGVEVRQDDCQGVARQLRYSSIEYLVYTEYHEWCDNILQLSDLRKFKFATPSTLASKQKSTKGRS